MTPESLSDQDFTPHLESVENEIHYSICTSLAEASNEIQIKLRKISLFINQSPKEKELLDLLGTLMKFIKVSSNFPEIIGKEFNEFTKQIDSEIKSRGERLKSTGIFTRLPPDKRDNLRKFFPDSLMDPLDEYLFKYNQKIVDFFHILREDLGGSLNSIDIQLQSLNNEVNDVIEMIDDSSIEMLIQLLSESLICWKEDIQDLENYWKRKIYSFESKLSETLDYLTNDLNRLIQIVIRSLKEG